MVLSMMRVEPESLFRCLAVLQATITRRGQDREEPLHTAVHESPRAEMNQMIEWLQESVHACTCHVQHIKAALQKSPQKHTPEFCTQLQSAPVTNGDEVTPTPSSTLVDSLLPRTTPKSVLGRRGAPVPLSSPSGTAYRANFLRICTHHAPQALHKIALDIMTDFDAQSQNTYVLGMLLGLG